MNGEAKVKAPKVAAVAPKKKTKPKSLDKRKARMGWLFVLPFVIIFLTIYVPIVCNSINYSFHEIVILKGGGYDLDWVGFDNYSNALFVDPSYVETLVTGIQNLLFNIPAIVIFSLFMAILLNQKMAGRTLFRAIFFIPVILSTGIVEKIDMNNSFASYYGSGESIDTGGESSSKASEIISSVDIQLLFRNMKVGQSLVDYVVDIVNNIYNIVNKSGVQMLIFLAGLQSISPAIYESCTVEGATAWETFWKITFPMISPMILVNSIYTIIDSFTSSSNQVMTYINEVYTQSGGNVLSSAMSWMYFLLVILIIAAVAGIISAFVFYQRRD
ncbi:MAG: sugar ABC transporter permease [Firmicutes bacterium]|nr:sugar ABC transporter permease [Bacillota bacterium]